MMITLDKARELTEKYLQVPNNRYHSYSSEVVMRALGTRLNADADMWAIAGRIHDLDWEQTQDDFPRHGLRTIEILNEESVEVPNEVAYAIRAHNEERTGVPRKSAFDFALAAGETVTGLVYAYALMRPERLNGMQASSLNKKFKDKNFASGVNRGYIDDIAKAGLERSELFTLAITAITPIASEIGLA